jgi:flagellar motility protein MotE (MotC chaperone)
MTTETEERLRELENKNIEFEDELQSMREENAMVIIKNKELLEYINLLNIRLREINNLVYDYSRDKPHEEVMKINADLIREIDSVKSEKMMIEIELTKIKDAIERRKLRSSKPETKKDVEYPNSPASFDFDGEDNEIFGESFVIDSNNKELEQKLYNIEEDLIAAKDTIDQKNKNIIDLQEQIEDLESMKRSKSIDVKKSESFEMMNSDTIKNIKGTLLQFLKNVPPTEKNNEVLLNVIFDMLYMTTNEIKEMKEIRAKFKQIDTPKKKKTGGIFGRMLQ